MYTNILVPYDGSEHANRALATAIELGTGDKPVNITALQVAGVSEIDQTTFAVAMRMAGIASSTGNELEDVRDNYLAVKNENMQEAVSKFFEDLPENINLRIVVKRGNARDIICDYADQNDIDCIVMGRRGLNGIRATLGSVSTGVLRGTDLPVLVVK